MSRYLHDAGEALYGELWQSALARDLDVSIRTMQRWAAGADLPQGLYVDLIRLCVERAAKLDAVADKLREVG